MFKFVDFHYVYVLEDGTVWDDSDESLPHHFLRDSDDAKGKWEWEKKDYGELWAVINGSFRNMGKVVEIKEVKDKY